MKITIQLFGFFSTYGKQMTLTLPEGTKISDLRPTLFEAFQKDNNNFNKKALLESSRFANETTILSESTLLKCDDIIAIIPPVSGG